MNKFYIGAIPSKNELNALELITNVQQMSENGSMLPQ